MIKAQSIWQFNILFANTYRQNNVKINDYILINYPIGNLFKASDVFCL